MIFKVSRSGFTFWFYCLVIFLLAILPLNGSSGLNDITILHFRADYFFHALQFIPWFLFNIRMKNPLWLWFLLGFIFASCSEFLQLFLTYRTFNINDLLANVIGIALGFMLMSAFNMYKTSKS